MTVPPTIQGSLPWRTCSRCIRRQSLHAAPLPRSRFLSTTFSLRSAAKNPFRSAPGNARTREQELAKYRRSMALSATGMAVCAAAMFGVIKMDLFGLNNKKQDEETNEIPTNGGGNAMRLDGPSGFPSSPSLIPIKGQDGVEQVETGTSSIPHFPSTIKLPKHLDTANMAPGQDIDVTSESEEEYQLLGLGIRTVSFLKIQVYVVGLYVAKSDISELQQRLVRTAVHPPVRGQEFAAAGIGADAATSLVPAEREQLKSLLLDPELGEAAWSAILQKDGIRTVFRIVPTRNTDFLHLRDGWVRGITARAQNAAAKGAAAGAEFQDESFGSAMNDFKAVFGGGQRKNVPKGQTLMLVRNERGQLDALFQPEPTKPIKWLGRVNDERVSRLVWLNYLAGKNVSSEGARQSVVEGIMGIVERPVGTVVQKVV